MAMWVMLARGNLRPKDKSKMVLLRERRLLEGQMPTAMQEGQNGWWITEDSRKPCRRVARARKPAWQVERWSPRTLPFVLSSWPATQLELEKQGLFRSGVRSLLSLAHLLMHLIVTLTCIVDIILMRTVSSAVASRLLFLVTCKPFASMAGVLLAYPVWTFGVRRTKHNSSGLSLSR